eukprot:2853539-Prymnesium_polylepis.1
MLRASRARGARGEIWGGWPRASAAPFEIRASFLQKTEKSFFFGINLLICTCTGRVPEYQQREKRERHLLARPSTQSARPAPWRRPACERHTDGKLRPL